MFVKVCGTTSEEDALLAVAMGADAVGFVFAPSPRQVAPQHVADIVKRLPPEIIAVGVFRDESPQRVLAITQIAGLKAVQLHGHEGPEDSTWLSTRVPMVIQAFPAADPRVRKAANYGAGVVLLDAPNPGSGEVFDWSLAAEVPPGPLLMIAGGLHPGNVSAAIARTKPWGVDVVTGVEREPGKKDPIKLREFIAAARAAAEEIEREHGPMPARAGAGGAGSPGEDAPDSAPYDWQEDA
ncbi:MAG TPA: phosphoribosylanthranilate isomerase [Acidimicrobiales bacterium]|nr:phosphoribosylanthranilate isomerase [Acidimicrobiales bacterium]